MTTDSKNLEDRFDDLDDVKIIVSKEAEYEKQLHAIIDAWEAIQGGCQINVNVIEKWLADDMGPAINNVRDMLGRKPYSNKKY